MMLLVFLKNFWRESFFSLQMFFIVFIGITAVTASYHYRENMNHSMYEEAERLMGSDLAIESAYSLDSRMNWIRSKLPQGAQTAHSIQFASMVYNEQNEKSALVNVRAVSGNYPLAGKLHTMPQGLVPQRGRILLDSSLQQNLGLEIGQKIKLGEQAFVFAGVIRQAPLGAGNFISFAQSVMIHRSDLPLTGLEKRGSRIRYYLMVDLPETLESSAFKQRYFREFISNELTLFDKTEFYSGGQKLVRNTSLYLGILGIFAYFIAATGIILSARYRTDSRFSEMAVYKCIGAGNTLLYAMFVAELLGLSTLGTIAGNIAGYYFHLLLPGSELVDPTNSFYFVVFLKSLLPGVALPFLVGLDSVLGIRGIRPVAALREQFERLLHNRQFVARNILLPVVVCAFFFLLIYSELESLAQTMFFLAVFLSIPLLVFLLFLLSRLVLDKIYMPDILPSSVQFALNKIKRPDKNTYYSVVALGSVLFIIYTTFIMKQSLLEISGAGYGPRPNMFVVDIRKEQLEYFRKKTESSSILTIAPVVGARLQKMNGKKLSRTDMETNALNRDWRSTAKTREYFLSYRNVLYDSEKIVAGRFWDKNDKNSISIEHEFMQSLGAEIGDSLTFNVQGVEISGIITNSRQVNWADLKPNFVVIFSGGLIESAPAYYISSFRLNDDSARYALQKDIVGRFPNVTVIDMEKSVKSLSAIISKIAGMIDLMSIPVFLSALLVIVAVLLSSASQRSAENRLLSVTGASNSFIRKISLFEGLFVAVFSAFFSFLASVLVTRLINRFFLKIQTFIPATSMVLLTLGVVVLVAVFFLLQLPGKKKIVWFL